MGKLHSLKKAILLDPEKWKQADGAYRWKWKDRPVDEWCPSRNLSKSYGGFIKYVLKNIRVGKADNGASNASE